MRGAASHELLGVHREPSLSRSSVPIVGHHFIDHLGGARSLPTGDWREKSAHSPLEAFEEGPDDVTHVTWPSRTHLNSYSTFVTTWL